MHFTLALSSDIQEGDSTSSSVSEDLDGRSYRSEYRLAKGCSERREFIFEDIDRTYHNLSHKPTSTNRQAGRCLHKQQHIKHSMFHWGGPL